jgi:hypothetical protein
MTFEEIMAVGTPQQQITALKEKAITVPAWNGRGGLQSQYDPKKHPVMNRQLYPDIVTDQGRECVTRVTYDLQRLAVKRMTELCNGIPVKRIYRPKNDHQKEVAAYLEAIFDRNRINSVNIERCNMLYASCEVMTLWYAIEEKNNLYGFDSPLKLRCRNFSPMQGDELYPLFDEYGDMIAMSVGYTRKVGKKNVQFFDSYSKDRHVKYSNETGEWAIIEDEKITLLKIPAIYVYRPTPIWESNSDIVYEMEWTVSRNGNYLRKNSKPMFAVFADEEIEYNKEGEGEKQEESRAKGLDVLQLPKGSDARYITWEQAIENTKFYVEHLRSMFFTLLQLPDWSYEKMSQQALSGESRKQLFIDAKMKVNDESGRLLEFYDREINVVKAFLKTMLPEKYHADIDALEVEVKITAFAISDNRETVDTLMAANGGQPIMSQRESIEEYGHSDNVDKTLGEIQSQEVRNIFEPTI